MRILSIVATAIAALLSILAFLTLFSAAASYQDYRVQAKAAHIATISDNSIYDLPTLSKKVRLVEGVSQFHHSFSIWLLSNAAISLIFFFTAIFTWIIALQFQILSLLKRKKTEQDAAANP